MSWPAWATESIEVVPYDAGRRLLGQRLAARLDELLAPWQTRPTEHVGSTAVPGLAAKPIVDLQVDAAHPHDREACSRGKADFVGRVLRSG